MSPDLLEGGHPRRSAVEKHVLYAIYRRKARAASVTAADLQLAERQGGACEDAEAFAELPKSDDESVLLNGKWNLCFPVRRILWRAWNASWAFCLRTKNAVLSKDGNSFQVYALCRAAIPGTLLQ
jgi:hypothetical protein